MTDETTNQPAVVASVAAAVPTPERYYCSNCRETWEVSQVRKEALDYSRQADGTLSNPGNSGRFSVFCKKCMKFLMIVDPATKETKTQFLGR